MSIDHRGPHRADRADIIKWADRMEARSEFPRLIRGLIRRNNDQLLELEMRAAEGTGLPGFDGVTRAGRGTPFVPNGEAVWELGTGADAKAKANMDYAERSRDPLGRDTSVTTFVFVTPREFRDKQEWAAAKRAEGVWADVRVFDVDDIEQALEVAPAVHARFSELVGKAAHGAQSVEDWWDRFAALSSPPLDPALVLAGRADAAAALLRLFEAETRVTSIAAASVDDVLAFVAASIMSSSDELRDDLLGRALIVKDSFALRALEHSEGLLIILPFEDDLRREARLIRTHHVVIRAEDGGPADVEVPAIDAPTFERLLIERGVEPDRASEHARAAGHSIVMFQRRTTSLGSAAPPWAAMLASRVARRAWMAGRWNERRSGDTDAMSVLLEMPYSDAREELVPLASGPDPLFVMVGDTWASASFVEAWRYGHSRLHAPDLAALEVLVQTVLGAVDPKLELPVPERWAASVYGKGRLHSSDLRAGVATVLAVFGALGDSVTIGSDAVRSWLRRSLSHLFRRANEDASGHLWASLTDVLPLLAEASPDVFLTAVQAGLDGHQPLLGAMFADGEGNALTASSPHTGLLWALETVVWSAEHFSQAVEQLARLAEADPGGRLSNRPVASLASVFRPWLPQTAVDCRRRLVVLDGLRERHPRIAWPVMLSMLPEFHAVGSYSSRPHFRDWAPSESQSVPDDRLDCEMAAASRLLDDAGRDAGRWVELIERFDDLPPAALIDGAGRLVDRVGDPGSEELRGLVWPALHALVQKHQRFADAEWALPPYQLKLLDGVQRQLAPSEPVTLIRWLFDDHLPDLPEFANTEFSMEVVEVRRRDAVQWLIAAGGSAAVFALAQSVEYPGFVGTAVADARDDKVGVDLLQFLDSEDTRLSLAAAGYAARRGWSDWSWVESTAELFLSRPVAAARVLLTSGDLVAAWSYADRNSDLSDAYWAEFSPYGRGTAFELAADASRRLVEHDRPRAALMLMNLYAESVGIDRQVVLNTLERLVALPPDHPDQFRVSSYEIERLLTYVRGGDGLDEDRLALLEWHLRPALQFDARSPVLERKLARDPSFFVEVLSLVFRPRNAEAEREISSEVSSNAYGLLDRWAIVPGSQDGASPIDREALNKWIDDALALLREADRLEIGLDQIGKILAKAPVDEDGSWPARQVREVIERVSRSELDVGFQVQVSNSRGVTSRGMTDGGKPERELAARYSALASAVADESPRVGAILRSVAESYVAEAKWHDERVERLREGLE